MMRYGFCAAALLCMATTGAVASTVSPLTIDISGVSGSNQTTWSFSGSQIATEDGRFESSENLNSIGIFLNIGDFTQADDLVLTDISGNAVVSVDAASRNIDAVYVDGDASVGGDDVGFSVNGASDFGFLFGQTVSFSGSLLVKGLGILDLDDAGLPFFGTSSSIGFAGQALTVSLNISEVAPVPLPAGLPLLVAGLGGLAVLRKRKVA